MKIYLLAAFIVWMLFPQSAFADRTVSFGPETSSINGSIKYTVVGRYSADFEKYKGEIIFDQNDDSIKSVFLEIRSASINSKHPSLDKIVRSKQLLDVKKFPSITFESKSIVKIEEGYQVDGDLTLHGVKREISSTFSVDSYSESEYIIKGQWVIRRKDFGITWSKVLDHGGVLVGDHITVKWEIQLPKGESDEK